MNHFRRVLRIALTATVLSVVCLITTAFAAEQTGTTTDSLRLREQANTSSAILTTAPKGASVTVLEDGGNGWYKVSYQGKTGYMSAEYVSISGNAAASQEVTYYVCATDTVNIRSGAGTGYDKVGKMPSGAIADLVDDSVEGWYQVSYNGVTGYVSADYSKLTDSATLSLGEQIVAYAMQFEGCSYVYGAAGPNSFDCSGLTKYVYNHFGYTLNRSANDQYNNGTTISKSELQPGDLVLFKSGSSSKRATHVGIYIGDGEFIHASTSKVGVVVSDLNSSYYTKVFVGARRII